MSGVGKLQHLFRNGLLSLHEADLEESRILMLKHISHSVGLITVWGAGCALSLLILLGNNLSPATFEIADLESIQCL